MSRRGFELIPVIESSQMSEFRIYTIIHSVTCASPLINACQHSYTLCNCAICYRCPQNNMSQKISCNGDRLISNEYLTEIVYFHRYLHQFVLRLYSSMAHRIVTVHSWQPGSQTIFGPSGDLLVQVYVCLGYI